MAANTYKHLHTSCVHLNDMRIVSSDVWTDVTESMTTLNLIIILKQTKSGRSPAGPEEWLHPPTARTYGCPIKSGEFYCCFSVKKIIILCLVMIKIERFLSKLLTYLLNV